MRRALGRVAITCGPLPCTGEWMGMWRARVFGALRLSAAAPISSGASGLGPKRSAVSFEFSVICESADFFTTVVPSSRKRLTGACARPAIT